MTQVYSDPAREKDPHALPNVEVFEVTEETLQDFHHWSEEQGTIVPGFYWWPCFPGCLPDGSPIGPFDTEQQAIDDAQDLT